MKVQYGDSCLSQGRVYEWVGRFQNGRQNFSDEHWSGRQISVASETVKQQNKQWNRDYRRVTIDEIVIEFSMSHGSVYNIVHDDLENRKVCSRWVPRQLSNDHKHAGQTICQEHLDCHVCEGDAFPHRNVTGDESWVYHYEPEGKGQSMQWKHPSSLANKKFKTQSSAGKVMLTIFWDVNGPMLVHFQEKGQTVTSAWYSDMLVNKLKPAIRLRRRGLLSKRVLLLHDNTCPHTDAHTVDTPCVLKFEVLKYPPYSPALVQLDFHLFRTFETTFAGPEVCRWRDNEAVQSWLKATPKSFFLEGIHKLVDRWTKCVAKHGDYVQK